MSAEKNLEHPLTVGLGYDIRRACIEYQKRINGEDISEKIEKLDEDQLISFIDGELTKPIIEAYLHGKHTNILHGSLYAQDLEGLADLLDRCATNPEKWDEADEFARGIHGLKLKSTASELRKTLEHLGEKNYEYTDGTTSLGTRIINRE